MAFLLHRKPLLRRRAWLPQQSLQQLPKHIYWLHTQFRQRRRTLLSREAAAFQVNALHGRRPVVCEKCKYIKSEARRVSIAARDWRTATPGKLGIYLRERGKTTYSYSILSHFLLHFRPSNLLLKTLPLIFLMSFRKSLMCRSGSR